MKPRATTVLLLHRDVTVWHGGCGRRSSEVSQERMPRRLLRPDKAGDENSGQRQERG